MISVELKKGLSNQRKGTVSMKVGRGRFAVCIKSMQDSFLPCFFFERNFRKPFKIFFLKTKKKN